MGITKVREDDDVFKVHTLTDAHGCCSLLWSGVEAQGSPNSTIAHCILFDPSYKKENHRSTMRILRKAIEPK
jgi:hypothetical protein